jgi:transcriptional regulator with XRE-family HTH domain
MDNKEFGRRVQAVREDLLGLRQVDIAQEMQISQAIYSRVERGHGAHIKFVFAFLNVLQQRNLQAHQLFREPFDLTLLKGEGPLAPPDVRAYQLMARMKDHAKEDLENMVLLMEILGQKRSAPEP